MSIHESEIDSFDIHVRRIRGEWYIRVCAFYDDARDAFDTDYELLTDEEAQAMLDDVLEGFE